MAVPALAPLHSGRVGLSLTVLMAPDLTQALSSPACLLGQTTQVTLNDMTLASTTFCPFSDQNGQINTVTFKVTYGALWPG